MRLLVFGNSQVVALTHSWPTLREPPPQSALEQMANVSGTVTAAGGSSFAVRIQKHHATRNASDADLASVLGRGDGLLAIFRALPDAHEHVHVFNVCVIAPELGVYVSAGICAYSFVCACACAC